MTVYIIEDLRNAADDHSAVGFVFDKLEPAIRECVSDLAESDIVVSQETLDQCRAHFARGGAVEAFCLWGEEEPGFRCEDELLIVRRVVNL